MLQKSSISKTENELSKKKHNLERKNLAVGNPASGSACAFYTRYYYSQAQNEKGHMPVCNLVITLAKSWG